MEKAFLEIIRVENNDAISTSIDIPFTGVCYKFTDAAGEADVLETGDIYRIKDSNINHKESFFMNSYDVTMYEEWFTNSSKTLKDGVWYCRYYDGTKYYLYPCDKHDHSNDN